MSIIDAHGDLHGGDGRYQQRTRHDDDGVLVSSPVSKRDSTPGGIIAVAYEESRLAGNGKYGDLTNRQRAVVRQVMDRLEAWDDAPAATSRQYDVIVRTGQPTVIYGRPRFELEPHKDLVARVEVDDSGNMLSENLAYADQWGVVWYEEDPDADDDTEERLRWKRAS
jgi:hypothetical protein